MKGLFFFLLIPVLIFAQNKSASPDDTTGYLFFTGFIGVVGLFFWGVYKATKTQKIIYTLAMLPFLLGIIGMFFL